MTQGTSGAGNILTKILEQAQNSFNENKSHFFVFDLDSTLFDVSPRIQQILYDFADLKETIAEYPEAATKLKTLKVLPGDWGIRQSMERLDLPELPQHFYEKAYAFWKLHFFSNNYLHYDQPYEGAVAFVNKIFELNHHIAYLTGRDQHRMKSGTIETLKLHGFPLEKEKTILALKPNKDMIDTEYKKVWFEELLIKHPENKFWFFENEPLNIHEIRTHIPHIHVIFFESTHAGKRPAPTDLPIIKNYKYF